ncbi:hypothetical protein [Yersinia mollaretii]|uniref:hypothetical protein n=1 Tax=Yersinia mollaretii TaxID=33060 RepID=UPI0025AB0A6F|nr:hypothetical protein [Yersinia mollaretii]MDN0109157.1 hypothetical protein [Yersinia mollaretii]
MVSKSSLGILLILFSITFIPSFIYVSFHTNSLATGFILLIPIMILISWNEIELKISIKEIFCISIIVFYTIYITFYWTNKIEYKGIISSLLLVLVFFLANQVSNYISKHSTTDEFDKIIKLISTIYLALGIFSIFYKVSFFNYNYYIKSSFPFSEPSHYAISCIPFLIYTAINSKTHIAFIYLFSMLLLSLKLPSIIMMVATMLTLFIISLRLKYKLLYYMVSIFSFYFISNKIIQLDMANYFTSRLDFSLKNTNMTTLVYIQGWNDLLTNLIKTNGIGLGFQQMGTGETNELNEYIFSLSGKYKNISDGSFLASKLVSEFGIIGIILLLAFVKLAMKCLFDITMAFKKNINDSVYLFSRVSIISFSVELFLRGVGYFSSSVVIFLISVSLLGREKWKQL